MSFLKAEMGNLYQGKTLHRIDERSLRSFRETLEFYLNDQDVFTGMWRFYYCQFKRRCIPFHAPKKILTVCAPDAPLNMFEKYYTGGSVHFCFAHARRQQDEQLDVKWICEMYYGISTISIAVMI